MYIIIQTGMDAATKKLQGPKFQQRSPVADPGFVDGGATKYFLGNCTIATQRRQ